MTELIFSHDTPMGNFQWPCLTSRIWMLSARDSREGAGNCCIDAERLARPLTGIVYMNFCADFI